MTLNLSEEDAKTLRGVWLEAKAPAPGKGPSSLDVATIDPILKSRLAYLGVDVNPGKSDANARSILETRIQFAHQYILDVQRLQGKKFESYGEIEAAINQMFLKDQKWTKGLFGTHPSQNVMSIKVGDIPGSIRDQIKADFKKQAGRNPQDTEILQAYLRSQFYVNAPRSTAPPRSVKSDAATPGAMRY